MISCISAVTFAVADMARSVKFYETLGFGVTYGGPASSFTTMQAGEAIINLTASPGLKVAWWGRVIFRVTDVDRQRDKLISAGFTPEAASNGAWGERYFHLRDPDGHELSFAQLLPAK